jgi:membrane protease YdiL (CAAX protease family)
MTLEALAYATLGLTILSLWFTKKIVPIGFLLICATLLALASCRLDMKGILWIACLGGLFHLAKSHNPSTLGSKLLIHTGIILLAVGFFTHNLPGFYNLLWLKDVRLANDSIPYSLSFTFDKPLFGLFYCYFFVSLAKNHEDWLKVGKWAGICLLPCAFFLLGTSCVLQYIRLDMKFPEFAWLWAAKNLLFTCVTEEALFRGYIQHGLTHLLQDRKHGSTIALLTAALLFGLAHIAGGWQYVVLASIAGLFYGLAYRKSGKIEAAILTHFSVNSVHFLFFSYPALAV